MAKHRTHLESNPIPPYQKQPSSRKRKRAVAAIIVGALITQSSFLAAAFSYITFVALPAVAEMKADLQRTEDENNRTFVMTEGSLEDATDALFFTEPSIAKSNCGQNG